MGERSTPPEAHRTSILLVDDQPANLAALEAVLERPDYDLVFAHSGEDALSCVLRQEFAVILLDVAMPRIDGFEVARIIKQRPASRTIPIIFVTASVGQIEWIFNAYRVGAVDFLQKPLDPHQVQAKVAVFVELFRQERRIRRQAEMLRERERREQAVELDRVRFQHERRFRNLADAIPHVVWVASPAGDMEYLSRRWGAATGQADDDAKGSGWLAAVHLEDRAALARQWADAIAKKVAFEFEFRLIRSDGAVRWHRGRALTERDARGDIARWLGTLTDVDEEKCAEEDLRAAVRMRDDFLSVASHELRTPVTALQLTLDRLRRSTRLGMTPDETTDGLDHAMRRVERLSALVDRLLDVSRLASGVLELKLQPVDLAQVVRDLIARMSEDAARAGCSVELRVDRPVPGQWDRLRIEQVLTNLLSNAFKYGAGKPVRVAVTSTDHGVQLAVADEGIGISPDSVGRIFGRFERAASVSHFAGLGLGLYIVHQIVEALGGKVQVESHLEAGSVFRVDLPRIPSIPVAARPAV